MHTAVRGLGQPVLSDDCVSVIVLACNKTGQACMSRRSSRRWISSLDRASNKQMRG